MKPIWLNTQRLQKHEKQAFGEQINKYLVLIVSIFFLSTFSTISIFHIYFDE